MHIFQGEDDPGQDETNSVTIIIYVAAQVTCDNTKNESTAPLNVGLKSC